MVISPMTPELSSRDDDGKQGNNWGPIQIAAPVIVGVALLLAIAVYVIWRRRRSPSDQYGYHQVRTDWVTKVERMFNSRRTRRRVVPSGVPTTLGDSMRSPHSRLGSTDSRTPLTMSDYPFDFPPIPKVPDSPPPMARWPAVRWWWLFGSRPQKIESEKPGSRWHVDGPDGSSIGHGHTSHEAYRPRYVEYLETSQEDPENGDIGATPTRPTREMSPLPGRSGPSLPRTPVQTTIVFPRSNGSATQVPSANHGLPPSYDVSHARTVGYYPFVEKTPRAACSESYVVFPPALRPAGASSPRTFNGRELSSESLRAQSPMVSASVH